MTVDVEDPTRFVYYYAGGKRHGRPIRTGDNALTTFESIPEVDVSDVFSDSLEKRKDLARRIGEAISTVGFFYAVNPPVTHEAIDGAFDAMKAFFARPEEEKMQLHTHKSPAARGYEPFKETRLDSKTIGDFKESFILGDDYLDVEQMSISTAPEGAAHMNQWPTFDDSFRPTMYDYYLQAFEFAQALVRIYALALDLPEDTFDSIFSTPIVGMNALHYPPTEAGHVGLGAHADFSLFTLLNQLPTASGGSALEVLNANGQWVPCYAKPYTLVVNVGDYLQAASNGRFTSTVHRVVNQTGEERYSLPLFFSPNPEAVIGPLPSLLKNGEEARYESLHVVVENVKRTFASRFKHPTAQRVAHMQPSEINYGIMQGVAAA